MRPGSSAPRRSTIAERPPSCLGGRSARTSVVERQAPRRVSNAPRFRGAALDRTHDRAASRSGAPSVPRVKGRKHVARFQHVPSDMQTALQPLHLTCAVLIAS